MKDDTKEIVSYVFVGGMTTLVNYVVYFILLKIHSHWLIANSISWVFAVLFAYYTNKRYVFKSTNNIKKEFISFILLRFMTLLIENICLYLLIDLLNLQPMISKVCVSFITIRRCGQFLGPKGTRRRKTWHIRNKKKNELSPYMMN